jgi:hypothetical protein
LTFFDIRAYIRTTWNHSSKGTFLPLKWSFNWSKGFYAIESDHDKQWRWSNKRSILNITNYDSKPIIVKVSFKIFTDAARPSTLILKNASLTRSLKVNREGASFSHTITLDPGRNKLSFYSDSEPVRAPLDPRHLYFRIQDFNSSVIDDQH